MTVRIAPSLLAADPLFLNDEIVCATQAGADMFHIDVMDGHYVPNLSFSPQHLAAIRKTTELTLDVHLMVSNPSVIAPWYIEAGADMISFHPETEPHAHRLISYIQSCNVKAGLTLNPGTPCNVIESLIDIIDFVLLMTVNPGYGGQKYIAGMDKKIAQLRKMCPSTIIEIDGGVNADNSKDLRQAGADILVAGSAIFNKKVNSDPEKTIRAYQQEILKMRGC